MTTAVRFPGEFKDRAMGHALEEAPLVSAPQWVWESQEGFGRPAAL